jgi:hypothetical protein
MEFLDINFSKDSIILLHAIHSPLYCRGLDRNPYSTLVLKNTHTKIRETKKLKSIHEWHL